MRSLPYYIQYGALDDLFAQYKKFSGSLAMSRKIFKQAIQAVTKTGTYNSALSYYWVEFIDMIKLVHLMLERL